VWDTVSSFGWLWDPQTLPDTGSNKYVKYVRHAVSIDEQRGFFQPNFFRPPKGQNCQEVWFPGVHADVGGGYVEKEAGLARISLRWMLGEAKSVGLRTDPVREQTMLSRIGDKSVPDHMAPQHNEAAKLFWRVMSLLPRRIHVEGGKRRRWNWPNRAAARTIGEGALIHESVGLRMRAPNSTYRPTFPKVFQFVGNATTPPAGPECGQVVPQN
jgi:hypothetical protein